MNALATEIIDLSSRRLNPAQLPVCKDRAVFRSLNTDIQSNILTLKNGETLHDRDEIRDSVFYVLSGCVKRMSLDSAGDTHIDEFYLRDDIFGLDVGDSAVDFSVLVACGSTRVLVVPSAWREANPEVVHSIIVSELRRARKLSFYIANKTAGARIAWFLCALMVRRSVLHSDSSAQRFTIPMSRGEIASYLGLAPETVSREFSALTKSGAVTVSNRTVSINDSTTLRSLAEMDSESSPEEQTKLTVAGGAQ